MTMIRSAVFLALICAVSAFFVDFKHCDNTKNAPQSVEIEECDSAQCSLDPEKKYNTAVRFVTPSSSKAAYFTDGHSACSNMSSCPFTAGEYVVYKGVLTGESLGHFELIDDARDSVVCFTI